MYRPSEQVERFKRNVEVLTHEQCVACLKEIVESLDERHPEMREGAYINALERAGIFKKV